MAQLLLFQNGILQFSIKVYIYFAVINKLHEYFEVGGPIYWMQILNYLHKKVW